MRWMWAVGMIGAIACSKPAPTPPAAPPPPPGLDDMVDAMCACTKPDCADAVRARFADVAKRAGKSPHERALVDYEKTCEVNAREAEDQASMYEMMVAMCACKDPACVEMVQRRFSDFIQRAQVKYGKGGLVPSRTLTTIGQSMAMCMTTALSAVAPAGGGTTPATSSTGSTGIAACDQYLDVMSKYLSCSKVPQNARDASRQAIEAMKQGWAALEDPTTPAEAKRQAAGGCTTAIDALRQSAAAMGCAL